MNIRKLGGGRSPGTVVPGLEDRTKTAVLTVFSSRSQRRRRGFLLAQPTPIRSFHSPQRHDLVHSHPLRALFWSLGIVASGSTPDEVPFSKRLSLPFNRTSLRVRIPFPHRGSAIEANAPKEGRGCV